MTNTALHQAKPQFVFGTPGWVILRLYSQDAWNAIALYTNKEADIKCGGWVKATRFQAVYTLQLHIKIQIIQPNHLFRVKKAI